MEYIKLYRYVIIDFVHISPTRNDSMLENKVVRDVLNFSHDNNIKT